MLTARLSQLRNARLGHGAPQLGEVRGTNFSQLGRTMTKSCIPKLTQTGAAVMVTAAVRLSQLRNARLGDGAPQLGEVRSRNELLPAGAHHDQVLHSEVDSSGCCRHTGLKGTARVLWGLGLRVEGVSASVSFEGQE